ncbi:MAG TPA: aminotransferase class I/II-fold pyridoxal phosphate-dependent enzyme [Anaerolineae bacterium]|jgi:dTDP-4-amino-4,6-dideoxygalactose transaminase
MIKCTLNELAVFGGQPAFSKELSVGCPNIGNRERLFERINDILESRRLTNRGPYVEQFEAKIAEIVGVRHCIAMCNATVALEIAIRALDLEGEVIIPSMTFIATAHALQWQRITPIFCDINPETYTLDPARLEAMITPNTTGIIGVHLWGRPCDVEQLADIAARYNLKLLYDTAHAFGCSHKGRMLGSFGEAEVFSFQATKFLNSFEGGAVVTNDDALAEKIRLMQNFGFAGHDNVIYIGTNGKMSEVSAAMGLTSLESLDEFITINYRNYKQYQQGLADIPGLKLLTFDETEESNYQYIVLEIDPLLTHVSRDQLVNVLAAENVLARRYFYPGCHRLEPYRSDQPHAGLVLPETERLAGQVITLPTGSVIGLDEINKICQIIHLVIDHGIEMREKLSHRMQTPTMPLPLNINDVVFETETIR